MTFISFIVSRAALLLGIRLITAFAVMLNALPVLRAGPSFHEFSPLPAIEEFFGGAGLKGHTHSHADDDEPESKPVPAHGQEYKDHSHVALGLAPPPAALSTAPKGKLLRVWDHCRATADPPFRLDRPPCLLSGA
jgi:hypothetical protein